MVCTLGNFSTKLLRGDMTGITRLHGQAEVRQIGPRTVRLYPLFHPAAALYTPSMLATLREDFGRIPELLAPRRSQPQSEPCAGAGAIASRGRSRSRSPSRSSCPTRDAQLGLF